jgi:hypothetical protein
MVMMGERGTEGVQHAYEQNMECSPTYLGINSNANTDSGDVWAGTDTLEDNSGMAPRYMRVGP